MGIAEMRHSSPRLPRGTVARARLLERLIAARHKTAVLLHGPAGCGKTTLALQWRAQALAFGLDFAWLGVPCGEDAESLLEGLFHSLSEVEPAIAREADFLYRRDGQARTADAVAIALLNGLLRHARPIVLLLDDYHHIADERGHQLLQMLLDFAPPHLHLVIVSRSVPPLSFSRLRERDALLELDFAQLRFTFAEAESFLQAQHPDLTRRDAHTVHGLTDGWIAGLRLASLELRRKRLCPQQVGPIQNAQEFVRYFEQEVLSQLSGAEVDALARLALPRRFNDALSVALLGAEMAAALMGRLRRENLFLIQEGRVLREPWFRFHPLFRDVLRACFERLPAVQRQGTHAELGGWFGRRRQLREAVRHFVAAGDLERAASGIERHARAMFLKGEVRALVRAVAELPHSVLQTRVSLRLWLAWSQLCYRRLAQCHQTIDALKAAQADDDLDALQHLVLLECSLAIQEDDIAAAERLLPALEQLPMPTDAILLGGRRNFLGWLRIEQGQFEAARQTLGGPQAYLEDGRPLLDSAFGALLGQCLLGYSYLHEGDMRAAERVLSETLDESDRRLGVFSEPSCSAAGFLAAVLYETHQLERLRALLEPRFDAIERVALPQAYLCAALTRIRLHQRDGSRLEALSELDRLQDLAQRRGLDRVLAFGLAQRTLLQLQAGDLGGAGEALAQLQRVVLPQATQAPARSASMRALAEFTRVCWLAASDQAQAAHTALTVLRNAGAWHGQWREQAQLLGLAAVLESRLGCPGAAQRSLTEALALAHRYGLVRSLLDWGEPLLALAELLRLGQGLAPTLAFYLGHLRAQAPSPLPAVVAPPDQPTAALSEREMDILKALASTMSNKRIAQALGVSPETVKWHLKNIYGKLMVHGRDGAVARARDLGWLEPVVPGSSHPPATGG